jgi:diguanylate cyclase (GGDEF)-like protein/PAS domain S-box-containing protein
MSVQTGAVGLAASRVLFESTSDGVVFHAADGSPLRANPALATMLGRPPGQLGGLALHGLDAVVDGDDPRWSLVLAERHRHGSGSGVVRLRRGDGRFAEFEVTLRGFRADDGSEQTCLMVRDIEARMAVEREMEELSSRLLQLSRVDDLTGFQNRRGLITAGTQILQRADRDGTPVEILYVDVRNVKELNERLGHHSGDAALQAVARALSVTFETHDVLARSGGTSFVVLALDVAHTGIDALVACVRDHLEAPDTTAFIGAGVDVTFGSTTRHPGDDTSLEDLVTRADRSMLRTRRDADRS